MPEATAAVAAAQLLAFCKDPVRYRPNLTHGREIPAGGLHAFRFAQGKFPHGLLRDLPAPERERLRRAANLFIRQICFWDGATHYQVLCVPPTARRETIKEHYHGLIALIHPDRQDAHSEHWPPEAAQRVNLAYAVLSDEARRAEYDARLRKSASDRHALEEAEPALPATASSRMPVLGRFVAARMRLRKPLLYSAAVLAGLFYAYTWLAADVPTEYETLESSTPLELSVRFVRNVFSSSDRPRYLAEVGKPADPRGEAATRSAETEPDSFFTPLWRTLSGLVAEEKPAPDPPARVALAPSGPPPPREPAVDSRNESGTAPPAPVAAVAPAMAVRRPGPSSDSIAMESLVASLVTYYERGDLERFMALFDADSVSVAEAVRLRADFRDFFRETRERRLQVQRVAWDPQGATTRATGTALLEVEYRDRPERLARPVALEVVVRMRDGNPRIARLTLFPHE